MNAKNSSMNKRGYEEEFSDFIITCITNAGGSLKVQHITGYMSQLKPEVRSAIGTTISDFARFFSKHKNLFSVKDNTVTLRDSSSNSGYDSDDSNIEPQVNLPVNINEGKGVIVKLCSDYGFIKSKEPIKTEIYFNARAFENKDIDLTSFLYTGAIVFFNAKRKMHNESTARKTCKYSAQKVWRADGSTPQDGQIMPKPRKTRETGLYDPLTLDGEGVIQNVFPNVGFIAVDGNNNNTVFFYRSRLANYENLVDLTKVLSKGDLVEFNAHRSTKKDAKARWEATKVWKKSVKMKQNMSKLEKREIDPNFQCSLSKKSEIKVNNKAKEMIKGQKGQICPRAPGAVIKFGSNELADGDSAVYYICGTQVMDIGWEFSEGDSVFFDAVKIKSAPGWKAVLVWTGDKPDIVLPTCIGNFSEFTDEENEEIASPIHVSKSSSYRSASSNSSLKSVSSKSESISSKSKEDSTDKDHRKWPESSRMICSPVRLPSFKETRSLKKESGDKYSSEVEFKKKNVYKPVSCWGDSPDPDDIDHQEFSSKSYKFDSVRIETANNDANEGCGNKTNNMFKENTSVENISGEGINEFSNFPKRKIKRDQSEAHGLKKKSSDGKNAKVDGKKFSNFSKKNKVNETETEELKEKANVKRFKNITGKINKVYSKFAEVISSHSQKTVSFFWNDFYLDGVSVEELELDDLKQVLKVGDSVMFNYFIIVDDSKKMWQKVSLAWTGPKPKVSFEMRPIDFIEQNNLTVTVHNESDEDETTEQKVTSKKFLAVLDDDDDYVQDDRISQTESCLEDGTPSISVEYSKDDDTVPRVRTTDVSNFACQDDKVSETESCSGDHLPLTSFEASKNYKDTQLPVDFKALSSLVCQLLRKDLFSSSSKVDLYSLSEEIINLVLKSYKKSNNFCDESSMERLLNVCPKCNGHSVDTTSSEKNLKDNEVQTIVTGDIMAENIWTDC